MAPISMNGVDQQVSDLVSEINIADWTRQYWEQGEFLALERLLPKSLVEEFMREVEGVRPKINRNFIPNHKKGGSVRYYLLQESAPAMLSWYKNQG